MKIYQLLMVLSLLSFIGIAAIIAAMSFSHQQNMKSIEAAQSEDGYLLQISGSPSKGIDGRWLFRSSLSSVVHVSSCMDHSLLRVDYVEREGVTYRYLIFSADKNTQVRIFREIGKDE